MLQPTQEQQRIVESEARALVVEACAGAAKTTTLGLYAGARPRARILYLAFSKAIQLEATGRMPANVSCRTTHSIAWRKAIELFGDDAGQRIGKTYTSSVARTGSPTDGSAVDGRRTGSAPGGVRIARTARVASPAPRSGRGPRASTRTPSSTVESHASPSC